MAIKLRDALDALVSGRRAGEIVVTHQGAARVWPLLTQHTLDLCHNPSTMGGGIPLALGLALAQPNRSVMVVTGDGSLLMNLGTLSTMARYRPGNLLHIVFDNGSLLSVGGFPTATSTGTDLAGVARACAIPRVAEADSPERLKRNVADALADETLTTIVAKVEAIGPKSFHMDLPLLENRFQFKRALEALRRQE